MIALTALLVVGVATISAAATATQQRPARSRLSEHRILRIALANVVFVHVPSTAGLDLTQAYARLHRAGMRVTFRNPFSPDCEPIVVHETPAARSRVPANATITLTTKQPGCGAGSPAVPVGRLPFWTVPDFAGRPLRTAINWVNAHSLDLDTGLLPALSGARRRRLLDNYTVISQTPHAGSRLSLGIGTHHGNEGSFRPTPLNLRCRAVAVRIHPTAVVTRALRYRDPQGWALSYPSSLSVEHSTSGPGMATFTEVTVANFAQRRSVVTGKTHDGGFILVRPPLNHAGGFPTDGVAFRMLSVDGGPAPIGTVADSRFPIEPATFARPRYDDFRPTDYSALGVPHELTRPIDADGQHYEAMVLIGPAASASDRAAIEAVIASLRFPRLHTGERVGNETVLARASRYPIGSFTLIHALGALCDGSVHRCHAGRQPFYLVHAPGRLHPPDLIEPCEPARAACTPSGAFYALGWTSEDVLGGYRSACHLRFDQRDQQFYCTNSPARWDRTGRAIRTPPGARFADGLQFSFAKVAWDGHVVFLPGLGGNPPRRTARGLLWPRRR